MQNTATASTVQIRQLGLTDYEDIFRAQREFTDGRDAQTLDELWVLEHNPVFTQGQAGKPEHLLAPGSIPVVQSDRGGQVTYHGPGQLVIYLLVDLKRKNIGVKKFVCHIERAVIDCLKDYGIEAAVKDNAPGVYVNGDKICQLGLRVRKGCSYHGLSLNVDMDLSPFERINPCGFSQLKVVQISDFAGPKKIDDVATNLLKHLSKKLDYDECLQDVRSNDHVQSSAY